MKLMKTVKKILALSTGAVMVGATVLSASAANLNEYPAPWVQNGNFNGLIVVGDNEGASPADVLGAIDIAISLQYANRVPIKVQAGGTGSTSQVSVVGGEAWKVEDLEVSERGTGQTETISQISGEIGVDELPTLLIDGILQAGDDDYDYEQSLSFDADQSLGSDGIPSRTVVFDKSNNEVNDREVGLFFYVKSDDQIARYSLNFDSAAESDLTNSDGDVGEGSTMYDFEGQTIEILGKEWDIIEAESFNEGDDGVDQGVKLTLMGGATYASLGLGETEPFSVAGKEYTVTLDLITSDRAKFVVNGESTKRSLRVGDTYKLSDGSLIGVRDVVLQEFDGGLRFAEFYIGANKVELKDDNIGDGLVDASLVVGNDALDSAEVKIVGKIDSDSVAIKTIELNIKADNHVFLPEGGMLSEQLEEPEVLMDAWDIQYAGLESANTEMISITSSAEDQYKLEFVDGNGNDISVPLLYAVSGTNIRLGSEDELLVLHEAQAIGIDDYFVVSDSTESKESERETYVVQYERARRGKIQFKVLNGDRITKEYDEGATFSNREELGVVLDVGGKDYEVYAGEPIAANAEEFDIKVNLNGDNELGTTYGDIVITTDAGAKITISGADRANYYADPGYASSAANPVDVSIDAGDGYDFDSLDPSPIGLNIFALAGDVDADRSDDHKLIEANSDDKVGYTSLGARIVYDSSDDAPTVSMEFPVAQRLAQVFIVTPEVQITTDGGETTTTEGGAGTFYETNEISVGIAVLAGEVTDIRAQNAIVVGGPCANEAANVLMGNPQPCGRDFTPNTGLIRLFEHPNGKVAMLVAGYNAIDTRRAARVVAEYEKWQGTNQFSGMDLQITGTSFTNIQISSN